MDRTKFSLWKTQFGDTVSECSKDTEHNRIFVESDVVVVNFDKVKDYYTSENNLKEAPSSVDSLMLGPDDSEIFVEFKAGGVNTKDLMTKIYDSVIIFSNLMDQSPKYLSEKGTFILVYNKEREKQLNPQDIARASVAEPVMKRAKKIHYTIIPPDLRQKVEKFLFNQVIELSNEDFKRMYLDSCPAS